MEENVLQFRKSSSHSRRQRAEDYRKQALWYIREHALELREGTSAARFGRRRMTETETRETIDLISKGDVAKLSLKHYAPLDVNTVFKNHKGVRTTLIDVSANFRRVRNHACTCQLIKLGCVPGSYNMDNKLKGDVMLYLMETLNNCFAVYVVNAVVAMRCVENVSLCQVCGKKEGTLCWPRCNHILCEVCFWTVRE